MKNSLHQNSQLNNLMPFDLYKLHNHWVSLCSSLNTPTTQINHLWQLIVQHYTEPQRHYHTLQHIQECLTLLTQHQKIASNRNGWL